MTNTDFIERFIPSRDTSDYLKRIGHEFSDPDKAIIIANHLYLSDEEKIIYLKELYNSLADEDLKDRILQEIEIRKRQINGTEYTYQFSCGPLFNYIFIPHDFQSGDIVRIIDQRKNGEELIGIILDDSDRDYEFYKTKGSDYSDVQIRIETPFEGIKYHDDFAHRHVNPIYLERVSLDENDERQKYLRQLSERYRNELKRK